MIMTLPLRRKMIEYLDQKLCGMLNSVTVAPAWIKCEQLHIYFNKEVADIPNVTLASNEGERNHSEHNTTLQNSSNTFHQTDPSNDIVKMSEKN